MSTADHVLGALALVAERDEVRHDLDVDLYGRHILDSLLTVELIVTLSEQFGIEISPAELTREDWATPRKIVAFVEKRVGP